MLVWAPVGELSVVRLEHELRWALGAGLVPTDVKNARARIKKDGIHMMIYARVTISTRISGPDLLPRADYTTKPYELNTQYGEKDPDIEPSASVTTHRRTHRRIHHTLVLFDFSALTAASPVAQLVRARVL